MAKVQLLSECCEDFIQTEEGSFHPYVKTREEAQAAIDAGQPLYCARCGETVRTPVHEEIAATRER